MSADAEMSAAIAAAAALEPTESNATETLAAADTDTPDGLPEDAETTVLDADGEDHAADDADDDGSAEADEADGGVADLPAVGKLFADGNVSEACKALGIDPKILNINEIGRAHV